MSLIVTMALVSTVSLAVLPLLRDADLGLHEVTQQLLFALASGVLFGAPIGLIFRAMARPGQRAAPGH